MFSRKYFFVRFLNVFLLLFFVREKNLCVLKKRFLNIFCENELQDFLKNFYLFFFR